MGLILDSLSRRPIAYATVVLLSPEDDTPVASAAADEQGRFTLGKLPAGSFRLRFLFLGYAARTRPIVIGIGTTEVGTVLLPMVTQILTEAVVVGQKPLVEVRPDRLIYNAEQDVSNAGGTAEDVLRKAPLLAIDGEGKVKMRGSPNFQVLVNNKPSPTLARNLAEALKSIPAELIQSVEIITTPSAKYDGEGTAGIINIVLKKGSNQAANGRVGLSSGNRNTNFNSSLNFRRGKLNFTSSASAGAWYNRSHSANRRVDYGSTGQVVDTLRQNTTLRNVGGWCYGAVGLDYDATKYQTFSLAGSINGYSGNTDEALLNRLVTTTNTGNQLFTRATTNVFSSLTLETTASYAHTYKQPGKEWSVLAQYAYSPGTYGYDFDEYAGSLIALEPSRASYRERSRGRTPGHETTLQTDFTQPLGEKSKLEMGLKTIFRSTGSEATVDTSRLAYSSLLTTASRRSTNFGYQQRVQAAYTIYTMAIGKKITASLGGRLERTALKADFRSTDTGFARSYFTPLPNASAEYTLGEASSLRVAYSRRITRPFIYYLNPFVDRSTPAVVSYGNPNLDPELTDSYEVSYGTSVKSTSVNAALSVRHTGNAIENVRLPTSSLGEVASTYANVAATTFYQFNVYISCKPTAAWNVSFTPDVQYIVRRSPVLQADSRGFTAGLNFNTSYKLNKTLTFQSFFYGSLRSPEIQGSGAANLDYSIGAKKIIWQDKAELTLNVFSPFNEYWTYRTSTITPYLDQKYTLTTYPRAFRVGFSYRFGQQQNNRQRKSISNDDTKGSSRQGG